MSGDNLADRRVAHVIPNLDIGGAEVLVARMAAWQQRHGIRPFVYCLEKEGEMAERVRAAGGGVRCLRRSPGPYDRKALQALLKFCGEDSIDLLHSHNFEAFFYSALAARKSGVPLLHTQHGRIIPFGIRQRAKLFLTRRYCRAFVGVSEPITKFAKHARWVDERRARTILNGVDTDQYRPDSDLRAKVRAGLSIDGATPVAICVARIAPVKDHETLIRGFAQSELNDRGHLLIVGDGPLRQRTEAMAGSSGCGDRIRFLGERSDVRDLLSAADLFVMTSTSEGISVSLLEAMACGLVPLVTEVGGNRQIITDSLDNGLLVPPSSPSAFAQGLAQLLSDRNRLAAVARNARASVVSRFGQEAMMTAYDDSYRELLEPG